MLLTEGKRGTIRDLLLEYYIRLIRDIRDAIKSLLGGTINKMIEAEVDNDPGYEKSERSNNDDRLTFD